MRKDTNFLMFLLPCDCLSSFREFLLRSLIGFRQWKCGELLNEICCEYADFPSAKIYNQ